MKKKKVSSILLITCILISFVFISGSSAQDSFYFSQTGHSISGNFLDFYLSTPNVDDVFGFPITEVFIGELGNRLQYFENVRLEENAFGEISISPIGKLSYSPGNELIEQTSALFCQQAGNWPFPVCFDFLDYYYLNGGAEVFGRPISGMEIENGRIIQYFENTFLEWTPDNLNNQIRVGKLGARYFSLKNEDQNLLLPILNDTNYEIIEIKADVFAEFALLEPGEVQTLYVYVTDQNGIPISDVNVYTSLFYSYEEKTQEIPAGITDENGIAVILFIGEAIQMENVRVIVTLNYGSMTINSETSFKINY